MAMTDAQRRANCKCGKARNTVLSCKLRSEKAKAFKAACKKGSATSMEARGTSYGSGCECVQKCICEDASALAQAVEKPSERKLRWLFVFNLNCQIRIELRIELNRTGIELLSAPRFARRYTAPA